MTSSSSEHTEWMDLEPWPGPVLEYPFSEFYIQAGRRLGKTTAEIGTALHGLISAYAKTLKPIYKVLISDFTDLNHHLEGRGRVRNHGPRPSTTYDRLGRRRY